MSGWRQLHPSRREWLGGGAGALSLAGVSCARMKAGQTASVAPLPLSAAAKTGVARAFRAALGKRRG
ncbi:MAG: hypothetical protein MUF01_04790, partial [Bryobacterales bacterium]|nr:hypothetical protein [Bryobacterales bacterium]